MDFLLSFIVAAIVFAVIDAVWLKTTTGFYQKEIGGLLLTKPNFTAAIIFYAIYVIGVVAFVILPAIDQQNWSTAFGYGALLGFVAYATYDLTNLATLKNWSQKVAIVDVIWGTLLTAVSAMLAYFILTGWLGL